VLTHGQLSYYKTTEAYTTLLLQIKVHIRFEIQLKQQLIKD